MEQSSLKKCVDDSAAVAAREVNNQCDVSRREAFVAVMQTGDLWKGDNSAAPRRMDLARVRAILIE